MTPYREIGTLLRNKVYKKKAIGRGSYNVSSSPLLKKNIQQSLDEVMSDKFSVCRKRQERKEVLHALGKVGGGHKPPKYSLESLVRC